MTNWVRLWWALVRALIILVILPSMGYAWGSDGHRIVGALADRFLVGSQAAREVRALLDPGENLESISMWADCAKGYCGELTAEMKAFEQGNPEHHRYHYTDIPFQRMQYDPSSVGASEHDIVAVLTQAIHVLQGHRDPLHNPHGFTPRQALLLLTHGVGDIHQPLHVGSAYLDANEHFVDPARTDGVGTAKVEASQGGNLLLVNGGRNLHAYWDSTVVRYAMKRVMATSSEDYVRYLVTKYPASETTAGEPAGWPRVWAEDSLQLAKEVHRGLVVEARRLVKDQRHGEHWVWSVSVPDEYDRRSSAAAEQALVRAGKRLALVLQAIWPAKE